MVISTIYTGIYDATTINLQKNVKDKKINLFLTFIKKV